MRIFEISCVLGKSIRLTTPQWQHIVDEHPEFAGEQFRIQETLAGADFVVQSQSDDTFHYVRRYAKTPVSEKFLLVVVRHVNGEGFVITAFFVNRIRKSGKVIVHGQETYDQL